MRRTFLGICATLGYRQQVSCLHLRLCVLSLKIEDRIVVYWTALVLMGLICGVKVASSEHDKFVWQFQ